MLVESPFIYNSFKNANLAIINMAFYRHRTKGDKQEYRAPRKVPCRRERGGDVNYTLWQIKRTLQEQLIEMATLCVTRHKYSTFTLKNAVPIAVSVLFHLQSAGHTCHWGAWSSSERTISKRNPPHLKTRRTLIRQPIRLITGWRCDYYQINTQRHKF